MWTNSSQASISIHALREEGDRRGQQARGVTKVFLSTPSARRATWKGLLVMSVQTFLSTPSARRATLRSPAPDAPAAVISIHALREEGDVIVGDVLVCCGGISIHALRKEGDAVWTA